MSALDVPERLFAAVRNRATSPLHDEQVAARLGVALGVLFGTCAVTGAYSHLLQHPFTWLPVPSRPAGLYRVTQGLHVTAGFAAIPVLLAKLWVVSPKLVDWPVVRDVRHAIERLLLLPLVGGGLFLLVSGVANVARWYPWRFYFPAAHYWAAWITIGALLVHVGATWLTTRRVLRPRRRLSAPDRQSLDVARPDRRRFLGGVGALAGLLAVGAAGGTVGPLSRLGFVAQRKPHVGPQGLPVNKTARQAHVLAAALDPAWRLRVTGNVRQPLSLSLVELDAMAQHDAELPIACVEGWSVSARWSGVPLHAVLDRAGAPADARVAIHSLQQGGRYSVSELNRFQARDHDTLLATHVGGQRLHPDHGYPLRLIAPNRPGVNQTKWVAEVEVQ